MRALSHLEPSLTRAWSAARALAARPGVARALKVVPPLVGAAMVVALVVQLRAIGWDRLARLWPSSPLFYALFTASYFGPIATELLIYRRAWNIGIAAAPVFLRKRVMNEALFGYSGEAYAVFWARGHARGPHAPLETVKDVNIISAIVSNLGTLALLVATLALNTGERLAHAAAAAQGPALLAATAFVLAVTIGLILKPRLFSLPARLRGFITLMHTLRLTTGVVMMMALWSIALPGYGLALWLTLAAWRNLIARLPFVPQKDLLFVNLAILALGSGGRDVAAVLAMVSALTLIAHLVTALACALPGMAGRARPVPA